MLPIWEAPFRLGCCLLPSLTAPPSLDFFGPGFLPLFLEGARLSASLSEVLLMPPPLPPPSSPSSFWPFFFLGFGEEEWWPLWLEAEESLDCLDLEVAFAGLALEEAAEAELWCEGAGDGVALALPLG